MDVSRLVAPRSIAIFGASERPSPGLRLIRTLESLGYGGAIYPINPKYREILGRPCYPALADLPQAPDVVAFCVRPGGMLDHFRELADAGVGAAVVYAGGFAEQGEEGRNLQAGITGICREAGIALCGPNCMGIMNPVARSATYLAELRDPAGLAGNVGLISHSGSIANGMLADIRRYGFSMVASTGNEAVVDTAALMDYLVDDPATRVIATFTETVRNPERYVAALDRAAAAGKPVVALKVGRSERARRAITSHTGGLSGESEMFSALLKAHRAIEVNDMDELSEVLAACQARRLPAGRRIAAITASGGQAELVLDVAAGAGIDLPPLPPGERAEIERVVGPITGDGNPLDVWGSGNWDVHLPHALDVLNASERYDAIVYYADYHEDQPMVSHERLIADARLFADHARVDTRPHYLINTRPGVMNVAQVRFLAGRGIPQLGGTRQGLGAIDRLARYAAPPRLALPRFTAPEQAARIFGRLAPGRTVNEFEAKAMLSAYGIPVSRERLVSTFDEAVKAAHEIGWPVVLKAVSDDIPHKSEYGLIAVRLETEASLRDAWERLNERIGAIGRHVGLAGFLVQEFVSEGLEFLAGVTRDPNFGPSIVLGMGGVDVEIRRDFSLRMLPLRQGDAEAMASELRSAPLFAAHRNRPAADIASLVDCIERLAEFAGDGGDRIAEIDLNPIKVLPRGKGVVVVDALIVSNHRKEENARD